MAKSVESVWNKSGLHEVAVSRDSVSMESSRRVESIGFIIILRGSLVDLIGRLYFLIPKMGSPESLHHDAGDIIPSVVSVAPAKEFPAIIIDLGAFFLISSESDLDLLDIFAIRCLDNS
jgi:hypothetical protein